MLEWSEEPVLRCLKLDWRLVVARPDDQCPGRISCQPKLFDCPLCQAIALEDLDLRADERIVGRDLPIKVVEGLNLRCICLYVQMGGGFVNRHHLKRGDGDQQGHNKGDGDDRPSALINDVPINLQIAEAFEILYIDPKSRESRQVRRFHRQPWPARRQGFVIRHVIHFRRQESATRVCGASLIFSDAR